MKCLICETECVGRTCSGSCRAKLSRRTRTDEVGARMMEAHADKFPNPVQPESGPTQHELQCESNNGSRHRKQGINTGPWKSMDELRRQEIDLGMVEHNRVSLPGDSDYVGCVTEEMLV